MKIEEVVHYLLRVDQDELRVIRDALAYFPEATDEFTEEESTTSRQLLNTISEMI